VNYRNQRTKECREHSGSLTIPIRLAAANHLSRRRQAPRPRNMSVRDSIVPFLASRTVDGNHRLAAVVYLGLVDGFDLPVWIAH